MTTEIIVYFLIILMIVMTWYKFAKHKFSYRKECPHTRYCCTCGQKQIEVHKGKFLRDIPLTHWVNHGSIKDSNCHCHDYTDS